jgi:hypothetical protein
VEDIRAGVRMKSEASLSPSLPGWSYILADRIWKEVKIGARD